MERKLSLKKEVKVTIYLLLLFTFLSSIYMISISLRGSSNDMEVLNYVPSKVTTQDLPVIKEDVKLIKPYTDTSVKIGKYYYDYKSDKEKQEKAITENDNMYMQNSGIDFISENVFDVISSLDGEIISVKDDEVLGKTVEIKHDNKYITVYQSLSEVSVKKGDLVTQGQLIGKSGKNTIDEEMGNHLHYELYIDGKIVNPEEYFGKVIEEKKQ